jgi:hypothetical protein
VAIVLVGYQQPEIMTRQTAFCISNNAPERTKTGISNPGFLFNQMIRISDQLSKI